MPTVRIELFEGRTPQQKAALAREITEACERVLGGSADSVDVLFSTSPAMIGPPAVCCGPTSQPPSRKAEPACSVWSCSTSARRGQ